MEEEEQQEEEEEDSILAQDGSSLAEIKRFRIRLMLAKYHKAGYQNIFNHYLPTCRTTIEADVAEPAVTRIVHLWRRSL
jgi:hypothetical protein